MQILHVGRKSAFCDAPYSAQRNSTKEEDIGTYFTSMTSSCHTEIKINHKNSNKKLPEELTGTGPPSAGWGINITQKDRKCLTFWRTAAPPWASWNSNLTEE